MQGRIPVCEANVGSNPIKKTLFREFFYSRLEGFEPPTFWFVAKRSIQLGYKRIFSFLSFTRWIERLFSILFEFCFTKSQTANWATSAYLIMFINISKKEFFSRGGGI